jgi:hypothetical protein
VSLDTRLPLSECKAGDDVIIRGTIDYKKDRSIWLVLDGVLLGRVVRMPDDVLARVTGTSPNYERTLLTPEEKHSRQLAASRKYREKKRGHEGSEP